MLYPSSPIEVIEGSLGPPLCIAGSKTTFEYCNYRYNDKNMGFEPLQDYTYEISKSMLAEMYKDMPDPAMIDMQPEFEWHMRPHFINFLVELHSCFNLEKETLFLACTICDRYLSRRVVFEEHYQLTVTIALWIAAKYEDKKSRTPTLQELIMMCREMYDKKLVLQMEWHMLSALNWEIGGPLNLQTCVNACIVSHPYLSSEYAVPSLLADIASYLCELSLYSRNYLYLPSGIKAVCAFLIASRICGDDRFPNYLTQRLTHALENSEQISSTAIPLQLVHDDLNDVLESCLDYNSSPDMHNLPFLEFTDTILDDIRVCSILYLNDLYKHRNVPNSFTALTKKYNSPCIKGCIEQFILKYDEMFMPLKHPSGLGDSEEALQMSALVFEKFQITDHILGLSVFGVSAYKTAACCRIAQDEPSGPCLMQLPQGEPSSFSSKYKMENSAKLIPPSSCISPTSSTSTSWDSVFSDGLNNVSSFPILSDDSSVTGQLLQKETNSSWEAVLSNGCTS